MAAAPLVFRLLVAVTLGWAAVAKARSGASVSAAAEDLGLPATIARLSGVMLVPGEALIAVGLILPTSRLAAMFATALLGCFAGVLVANLLLGVRPSCGCFGGRADQPIGWTTVARNCGLVAAAAIGTAVSPVIVVPLAVAAAAAGAALVRSTRGATKPLRVGRRAPRLGCEHSDGAPFDLTTLSARGKPVLLVFASEGCGPCERLLPEVAGWQSSLTDALTIAVIWRGEQSGAVQELDSRLVGLQDGTRTSARYGAHATPSAQLVGIDGRIRSSLALGAAEIRRLVAEAAGALPPRPIGPGDALPDLGPTIGAATSSERLAVVIRATEPRAYDAGDGSGLHVVVLTCADGAPARHSDECLAAAALGLDAEPSALLIAADDRVASEVTRGSAGVRALINRAEAVVQAAERARHTVPVEITRTAGSSARPEERQADGRPE